MSRLVADLECRETLGEGPWCGGDLMAIPTDSLHLSLLNKRNQSPKWRLRLKSYPDLTCFLPKPNCSRKSQTERGETMNPREWSFRYSGRAFTAVR